MIWISDDDAEMQALARIIADHLPKSDDPESDDMEAGYIGLYAVLPISGVWHPPSELGRLEAIWRAAIEIQRHHDELHPDLQVTLRLSEGFNETLFDALVELPRLLRVGLENAKSQAHDGKPPGQTNWRGIMIVDACRTTWERRTGKPAPITMNPAAKFGRFVADVFGVFGIDSSPRAMMRAWRREVHSQR